MIKLKTFNKASAAAIVPLLIGVLASFIELTAEQQTGLTALLTMLAVYFIPNATDNGSGPSDPLDGLRRVGTMFLVFTILAVQTACSMMPKVAVPETPAQIVFALHGGYAGALVTLVAYDGLEECAPASSPICKNPDIMATALRSKDVAKAVLDGAQATVRDPYADEGTVALTVVAAQNAIKAFVSITNTLRTK